MNRPEDRHQNPVLLLRDGPEDLLQHRELLLHDPEDLLQRACLFCSRPEGLHPHWHGPAQRTKIFEQNRDNAVLGAEGALKELAMPNSKFFQKNSHLHRSALAFFFSFAFPAHSPAPKLDPPRRSAAFTGRRRPGWRCRRRDNRRLRQQGIMRLRNLLNQPARQRLPGIPALLGNL
jgi:hypothetical protein